MAPLVFLVALAVAASAEPGADIVSGEPNQLRQRHSLLPVCTCAAIWYDRADCPADANYGCPKEPCDKGGGNERQCNVQVSPCTSDPRGQGFIECGSDTPIAKPQCNPWVGDDGFIYPHVDKLCMSKDFVLDILTSTLESAETITDPMTRTGFGGAHVSFFVDGGWTDNQTFLSDSAQKGEHVIFKFRLSKWPSKIKIIGRGQDAWGYDSIKLSYGDDARMVLKSAAEGGTPTPAMCPTCEHWVGGNRDIGVPLEHTYVIPNGECVNGVTCGVDELRTDDYLSKACATPNCEHAECCAPRARCSAFTCPANYEGQPNFANIVCAGTSCSRDECCKEAYPVKCTDGWYGNAQCHGQVTGCKKAKVFTRHRGEYCEKGSQAVIKNFVPHTTSTADAEQVRNDCEAFCEGTDGCWGCSVSFVWNAIPTCGNIVTWSGKINGDVSENPNVEDIIMTPDAQELERVRAERDAALKNHENTAVQRDAALTRMADMESELVALKATKDATPRQEVAPAIALAAQEHEPSTIVVAAIAGIAVAAVALISLGLAMKSFGLVLKAKGAQPPTRVSLITDNE